MKKQNHQSGLPQGCLGVLLAAGAASRFGAPKLLAPLAGRPLIAWPLEAMLRAGLERVLLVSGHGGGEVWNAVGHDPRLERLSNPEPQRGMGSSLSLAGERAGQLGASYAVILLADMPLISAGLIISAARAAGAAPCGAAAARVKGRFSHPVVLERRHFARLASLRGDAGARDLLKELGGSLALVPAPEQAAWDVDTPQDLRRVEAFLASHPAA